ncbi:hypothetical protein [Novipirellula rosea]|uniref:Secreted protein n=1 Tax=Novipirellula rosea TaxID=1031540 RepID=A0ABP8MZJ6_9BACT
MKRYALIPLLLFSFFPLLSGCSDPKPTSVTEGLPPSAIEEYKANEKKLMEETQQSMK